MRPENNEDMRKIGAKGNICLLHISRWGITIALQVREPNVILCVSNVILCVSINWNVN